jgi:hypothetical protein
MHTTSPRLRKVTLCALVGGGLLGLAWAGRPTVARPVAAAGGFGGAAEEPEPAGSVVYVREPLTAKALAVHAKLSQPVDMPFTQETPLESVLRYVRKSTEGPDMKDGIPIYIDPIGLTEAEKTPMSPVVLDLKGIPLAKSLKLALRQLGLTYAVDEDGLLLITSEAAADVPAEPTQLILDELARLRRDVAELKSLLGGHAGGAGAMRKQ